MTAVLVDTNILVYAFDQGDFEKQALALAVLMHLEALGLGRLSTQSLAEFYNVTTRPPRPLLTKVEAAAQVEYLTQAWQVFDVSSFVVIDAIRGAREHQMHYWDAQVWAVARLNQVPFVFSEDCNPGATLEGVRFINPFAEGFDLKAWT